MAITGLRVKGSVTVLNICLAGYFVKCGGLAHRLQASFEKWQDTLARCETICLSEHRYPSRVDPLVGLMI